MTYLNVVEVESALASLASAYPTVTELIALPYTTHEGRTSHALRIGHDSVHDGVLFTACARPQVQPQRFASRHRSATRCGAEL